MPPEDDFDLDEIVGDSNGGAYRKVEQRNGPPLDYVAEKARASLELLHQLHGSIREHVPDDLPQPTNMSGSLFSTKDDALLPSSWAAFRYAVVSYLALKNMLDLANGQHEFIDQLLDMSHDDFEKWLDVVDREGSVTG